MAIGTNTSTTTEKRSQAKSVRESTMFYRATHGKTRYLDVTEDDRLLISTSRLAELFGVAPKTVSLWVKQGCPRERTGWYDLAVVLQWKGRAAGVLGVADSSAEKLQADIRLKQIRAAMAETDLQVKRGELISMVLVEEILGETLQNLRNDMIEIGNNVMTEVYSQYPELAPQVKGLIDGYIRKALEEVGDTGRYRAEAGKPVKKAAGRPKKAH